VRFVTYNIHHAQGVDGRLSTRRIARVLAALNADVIGLNEVAELPGCDDQAAQIAEKLGMQHSYAEAHRYWVLGAGNAILTRGSIVEIGGIDLPGGIEGRDCLICTIELDGMRFKFATTHLSLNREARSRSLEILVADLPDDLPLVLSGDFNAPRAELDPLRARLSLLDTPPTFPAWRPTKPLDVIAHSGHWTLLRTLAPPSLASDHRPLIADLEISAPS
jgi:endonuclease/exonuclease/phosphatase family metal-dependent hydrolase